MLRFLGFIVSVFLLSFRLSASSGPELQQLEELEDPNNNIHKSVSAWFAQAESYKEVAELTKTEFAVFKKQLNDPIKELIVDLYQHDDGKFDSGTEKLSEQQRKTLFELRTDPKKYSEHPLYHEALYQLYRVSKLSSDERGFWRDRLFSQKQQTCAKKNLIIDLFEKEQKFLDLDNNLEKLMSMVSQYRSDKFQKLSMTYALGQIEKRSDRSIDSAWFDILMKYPDLIDRHAWLKQNPEIQKRSYLEEPYSTFSEISDMAKQRKCRSAQKKLISLVNNKKIKSLPMNELNHVTDVVGTCFQRYGHKNRIKFWKQIASVYGKALGFEGEEIGLRQLGLIYWGRDEFKQSKEIFFSLLERAPKDSEIASRNLYTMARIHENEGNVQEAKKIFTEFIARFPADENVPEALKTLAILNVIEGNYVAATHFTKQIIERESLRPYDEQDTSMLSFALFWSGSLSLKRGDVNVAFTQWRRLVNEFYSTFYGALGHYMLEVWMKKPLMFHPRSDKVFSLSDYVKELSPVNQNHIRQAEHYLNIGLKGRVSCEIAEMEVAKDKKQSNAQNLVKSLYFYASDQWLAAIRSYSSLDRSFRHVLPAGMERILFPRKYVELIEDYASRISVDSSLVFAVTRQESVFNRRALSPVGAAGLMQLMPATARLEARRLSRSYVTSKNGKNRPKRFRGRLVLFDPETNIMLGVHHLHSLFKRYRHPVYVLTSYNANPRATRRWMKNISNDNMLSFVERIPYKETRAYVKLVMRNYFYYSRWYTTSSSLRRLHEQMPLLDDLVPNVLALAKSETKFAKKIFQ